MTDTFNSDVFKDWGKQLVTVIEETAGLIYNEKEIEIITNGEHIGKVSTRRDFSILIVDIITKAVYIKIDRHYGEAQAVGYLLLALVLLDSLKDSVDPSQDEDVLEGIAISLERCDVEIIKLEAKLIELIKELDDIQIQHIHSTLVEEVDSWSSKAIDLFTLAEINSVGE